MPTDFNTVVAKLTSFGQKAGDFNQGARRKTAGLVNYAEGYCNGVCHDWARRVLQGSTKVKQKGKVTYGGDSKAGPKVTAQVFRQGTVQGTLRNVQNARVVRGNEATVLRNDLIDVFEAHPTGTTVPLSPDLARRVAEYYIVTPLPTNGQYDRSMVEGWIDELRTTSRAQSIHTDAGWQAVADLMDPYHHGKKQELGKNASSRPFSGIKLYESVPREYVGARSISAAIERIVHLVTRTMVANVTIAGFGLHSSQGQDTGHAVAFYHPGGEIFYLFDPNYGVFRYDSAGISLALKYLFEGEGGNPSIYAENGCTVLGNVSYVVFVERTA